MHPQTRHAGLQGLREVRRRHAQDFREYADRGAARSARAIPGESQVRTYLRHPFWQAVGLLILAYLVIVFVIPALPGSAMVPGSVVLQYMATVLVGVLIWVSDDEARWTQFKEPLHEVLIQPRLKMVRNGLLAVVTLVVGCLTYSQVKASVAAPPNLRSIHPAPPSQITFRGKTIALVGLDNPLRRPGGGA